MHTAAIDVCEASESACFFFCMVRSSGASKLSCARFAVGETAASESSLAVDIDSDEVWHLDAHTATNAAERRRTFEGVLM